MPARRTAALALTAAVLAVLSYDLATRRQLGTLAGLTDEWIALGANLAVHGTLGLEHEPWLLRPPGYPAFIALPLFLAGAPRVVTMAYLDRAQGLVFAAQALALAASALLTFLWLSRSLRPVQALAAAVTLALNPLSVALVGLLQYGVLHVLGIVAGLWLLDTALAGWPERRLPAWAAGALWGLVSLVRPQTLLLPPFVFLAWLFRARRPGLKQAAAAALVFAAAEAAVVAPWTARNYVVSGRFVPVNLQGWANVWAATLRPLPVDTESYRWSTFGADILAIQEQVTGRRAYDLLTYVHFNAELEQAYRRESLANLRRQPGVFALNAVRTLRTLATGTSTVLLAAFRLAQRPEVSLSAEWFAPGAPHPFDAERLRAGFRAFSLALSLLAGMGLLAGLVRRSGPAWVTAVVAVALLAAHAGVHLEFTYLYVKLPFLVVLAAVGTSLLSGRSLRAPGGRRVDLGDAVAVLVALGALSLTVRLLRP